MRQIKEIVKGCLGIVIIIIILILILIVSLLIRGCADMVDSSNTSPVQQREFPMEYYKPKSYQVCPSCKGKGKVTYEMMKEAGVDDGVRQCPRCSGTGHIYE